MSKLTLPQGSTLRTIVGTLTEEYVRAVLANVAACDRELGDAVVHLSLTGDGHFPDYGIDAIMDLDTGQATSWQDFSGKTHKPLRPTQEKQVFWSCERMTRQEVSALLGEIRGYKLARKSSPKP